MAPLNSAVKKDKEANPQATEAWMLEEAKGRLEGKSQGATGEVSEGFAAASRRGSTAMFGRRRGSSAGGGES